jgi:uncharacterized protein (UPF0264 family)
MIVPQIFPSPGLLVSVRSAEEAEAALAGGAHIIDVKEPDHGSLGRADDASIAAVLDHVAGRRPVSAALGELAEEERSEDIEVRSEEEIRNPNLEIRDNLLNKLAFVKWGLAGCGSVPGWQGRLARELSRSGKPQLVVCAYADWQCARAPAIDEVVAFACKKRGNVLLIDTHCKERGTLSKDRSTLLDWLPVNEVTAICKRCHEAGVRVALAGSLGVPEVEQLRDAEPDWFAVRGAVCEEHDRRAAIDEAKVRRLVQLLA